MIFQSTDLVGRRVEVLKAAREGEALLRDKDGAGLVMLPEHRLRTLEQLAVWSQSHLRLEELLKQERRPSLTELGDLGWLRVFDLSDLREFVDELHTSLFAGFADRNTLLLDECLDAWRATASELEDPLRRNVLLGEFSLNDYADAERPK